MDEALSELIKTGLERITNTGSIRRSRVSYLTDTYSSLGEYGAVCWVLYKKHSPAPRNCSGLCHGNMSQLQEARKGVEVILSFPFTMREKELNPELKKRKCSDYTEGFLDSYYMWLTTTPLFKGVFLEPWNGEYLVISPSAPANLILCACIASRWPTEAIYKVLTKEWVGLKNAGVGWIMSMCMAYNMGTQFSGKSMKGLFLGENPAGSHFPFNIYRMSDSTLTALLREEQPTATLSLPYDKGGVCPRVFALFDSSNKKTLLPNLISDNRKRLNYQEKTSGWNTETYYDGKDGGSKFNYEEYFNWLVERALKIEGVAFKHVKKGEAGVK